MRRGAIAEGSAVSYIAAVLADSPKAFWQEQDASGGPVDSSGNGLDLGLFGGGTSTYQVAGPGTSHFAIETHGGVAASRSTISTVTDNFTMEFWIYPETVADVHQGMFYNGNPASNGYQVQCDQTTLKYYGVLSGVGFLTASTTALTLNAWQYIVIVRRSTQWEYWRNATQDATNPGTAAPTAPSGGNTRIGNPQGAAMQARQAYVAFYETALSSTRITAHYAAMS